MKIGELAKQTGVGIDALRYYERLRLLTSERRPSGYRAFTQASVERVRFLRELQSLGLSLDEIRAVLDSVDEGVTACDPAALDAAVARVDARLAELRAVKRRLLKVVRECKAGACLVAARAPRLKPR